MPELKCGSGEVHYTLTDATHVYITGQITVFSVTYNFTLHLYRQLDGSWSKDDKPGQNCFYNLYLNRVDSMKDASFAARNKVEEIMVEAWEAHVNDDERIEAEKHHIQEELDKATQNVTDLEKQLEKAEQSLGKLDRTQKNLEVIGNYLAEALAKDYTRYGD